LKVSNLGKRSSHMDVEVWDVYQTLRIRKPQWYHTCPW
jgi:hypothetical protein